MLQSDPAERARLELNQKRDGESYISVKLRKIERERERERRER